jgi:hypothetical protein
MKKIIIRYYNDGSVELPDGRIIYDKDLLEQAANMNTPFPVEMFREVFDLIKTICLEDRKKIKHELNDGETVVYFEFVDTDLSHSRNPALNN